MGGLFSKEKKTKQHESKVTEQDKAILVRFTKSFNYYDTYCEISNLLGHSCYFVHLVFKQMFAILSNKIWEWSNAHFFLFCSLVIPANLEVVFGPWRNPVFFFGGGDHTVVWVGQVPGPFLVTFLYVINEFEKFPRGVKTLITPPPPFPVKFTAIN